MSIKTQRRLAASIMRCGKGRIWFDPNETNDIAMANSRLAIKKLISNGLIIRKAIKVQSTSRKALYHMQKKLGRHRGLGKRRGTKNARMPEKILWMRRQRVIRRLLRKMRDNLSIDNHMYKNIYLRAKGNQFKNKNYLIDVIHGEKNEKTRLKHIDDQLEARRQKNSARKLKKQIDMGHVDTDERSPMVAA